MVEDGLYVVDYDGDYSEDSLADFWQREAENGVHEFIFDKVIETLRNGDSESSIKIFRFRSNNGIAKLKLYQLIGPWVEDAIKYFEREDVEQYEKCRMLLNIKIMYNQKTKVCQ